MDFKSDRIKVEKNESDIIEQNVVRNQTNTKVTNFTIDHILNKAGTTKEQQQIKIDDKNDVVNTNNTNTVQFQWLSCTRYHPPKLARSNRNVPVRRTPGRLPRIPFSPTQLRTLEKAFAETPYLSSHQAGALARTLHLTDTRVKIWFQNRRARARREPKLDIVSSTTSYEKSTAQCYDFSKSFPVNHFTVTHRAKLNNTMT